MPLNLHCGTPAFCGRKFATPNHQYAPTSKSWIYPWLYAFIPPGSDVAGGVFARRHGRNESGRHHWLKCYISRWTGRHWRQRRQTVPDADRRRPRWSRDFPGRVIQSHLIRRGRPPLCAHAARSVDTRQKQATFDIAGRPLKAVGALRALQARDGGTVCWHTT